MIFFFRNYVFILLTQKEIRNFHQTVRARSESLLSADLVCKSVKTRAEIRPYLFINIRFNYALLEKSGLARV